MTPQVAPRARLLSVFSGVRADIGAVVRALHQAKCTTMNVAEVLGARGFAVKIARDGAEAWSLLNDGYRPGVILLDLMMPVMDGWTLRRKLLTVDRLASIPVVLMTTSTRDLSQVERIEAVVRKPFDVRSLLAVLDVETYGPAASDPLRQS